MYKSDPLTAPTREDQERTLAESYPRFASEIEAMTDDEFFRRSGELSLALTAFEDPIDTSASRILDLHRRHAREVSSALEGIIRNNARAIRRGEIPPTSVLGMILGTKRRMADSEFAETKAEPEYFYPSSDYRTVRYREEDLSVRPAAAQILQAMHEEYVSTRVPTVSLPVIRNSVNLRGDLAGHLRHCESIWKVIVGPGGKDKVKFLVLPHPDSRDIVFRSEE